MRTPTIRRWHIVAIILALCIFFGAATGFIIFYRLLTILFITFVGSYLYKVVMVRGLTVEAQIPPVQVTEGDSFERMFTVHNRSRFTKPWVRLHEESDLGGPSINTVFRVQGTTNKSWKETQVANTRGVYTIGPIHLYASDPFGLFQHHQVFQQYSNPLTVFPRTEPVPFLTRRTNQSSGRRYNLARMDQFSPAASSVREYLPGESLNRIHWNTTARVNRLMMKQLDPEQGEHLELILDLNDNSIQPDINYTQHEHAIRVTGSLAKRYLTYHIPVGLTITGQESLAIPHSNQSSQLEAILTVLSRAQNSNGSSLIKVLGSRTERRQRYGSIVIITSRDDPTWISELYPSINKNVSITVILIADPSANAHKMMPSIAYHLLPMKVWIYVANPTHPLNECLNRPIPPPNTHFIQSGISQ